MHRLAWLGLFLGLCFLASCAHRRTAYVRGAVTHVVRKGETLSSIARHYSVRPQTLAAVNQIYEGSPLLAGQVLQIPHQKVKGPSSPAPAAQAPELDKDSVGAATCADPQDSPPPGRVSRAGFIWPVDGLIVSRFGRREGLAHDGLDIAAPVGRPIWASAGGEVIYAGRQTGYGRLVILRHKKGRISIYAHNHMNCVREGAEVRRGQLIALVGKSGRSNSPFVHFEIRNGTKSVNPRPLLP